MKLKSILFLTSLCSQFALFSPVLSNEIEYWERTLRINPKALLMDIPETLMTERLILRIPQFGEGAERREAMMEDHDQMVKFWEPYKSKPTIEQAEARVRRDHARYKIREALSWHIFERKKEEVTVGKGKNAKKETRYSDTPGRLIGFIKLHSILWSTPQFSFSYWLRKSAQGNGYMTEAVRRVTDFVFDDLKGAKLILECDAANAKSCKIADRIGFRQAKKTKKTLSDGSKVDWLVYEYKSEDYKKKKGAKK